MRTLFIISLFALLLPMQAQKLTLTDHGTSNYVIIVPAMSSAEMRYAANIVQTYIHKISGALIPIHADDTLESTYEIVLGKSIRLNTLKPALSLPTLKYDGFWIKTVQNKLMIYGESDQAVLFGVTGFLEDYLGCRRYSPMVEKVPLKSTLILGKIDDVQIPPADIRLVHGANNPDFMAWRKLGVAKGWGGPYFVHTFTNLIPATQYFESNPEYFALVRGKRIPDGQLCLTNPALVDISVKKLRQEMANFPAVLYWSVSQNDNRMACECDACKAIDSLEGSPAGTLLRFVNQIADSFPDKIITTLAYQYTRKPPKITKPAKNLMVTLCSIELNRSKAIAKDKSAAAFRDDLSGWSRICDNLMLWDYEVQFTNYLCPFPLLHTLQPNIQYFNQNKVHAHFQQADVFPGTENAELKAYVISKLLWNPDIKVDKVIDDFMQGYYEEAAPFISNYIHLLHKYATKSGSQLNIFGSPVWYANTFLSEEYLNEYARLFDQAESAARHKPQILERVRIARLPLLYAELEIAKAAPFGPRGWYEKSGTSYLVRHDRQGMLDTLVAVCRRNSIQQLKEGGPLPEVYREKMLKLMAAALQNLNTSLSFLKPVQADPLPEPRYGFGGPGKLTNGSVGSDDFRVGYLGWKNVSPVITVDLERDTLVSEITLSSFQFSTVGILHPREVEFLASGDGKTFESLGNVRSEEDQSKRTTRMQFSWRDKPVRARYLRLKVTATGLLPDWHYDHGKPGWVFLEGVVVR